MTAGGAAAAAELPLCPVCCETLGRWGGPATLPCGHNGCLDCFQLVQQRNAQCPLCRANFGRELKLTCNHELEDLIRLATMLFVDESAQQDGWEAFPTQQLTADSYAAELIRGHRKAAAAAAAATAGRANGNANTTNSSTSNNSSAAAARSHANRSSDTTSSPGVGVAAMAGPGGGALGLSGLGIGLGLSGLVGSLGFGGSGSAAAAAGDGGNLTALEDLHDIMTADPLAAPPRRRRHSDGSSGGLDADVGGDCVDDADDWPLPSAPALVEEPDGGAAAGRGGAGALVAWEPLGSRMLGGSSSIVVGALGGSSNAVLSLEPPLWLPDSHAAECLSCHMPFRPFTRLRHHCRLCGKIFCSACCHKKALLPPKYGVRTPQRVCELCSSALAPHQQLLAGTLAAAAQPPVQDSPDAISLRAWLNSPWTASLADDVFKAANMLSTFVRAVHLQPEAGLPTAALQGAEGLALLTVARLGAGWSFSFGTGLVVARTATGWSAPCAISAAGLGWGLQLGGELADVLLVLRSREALSGLCGGMGAGVVVGGAAALAMGPVGRHADASLVLNTTGTAAAYGYSCSRGAFVGLSVESSLLRVRTQVNLDFYGYAVTPRQLLLEATVPPPPAAAMLYEGIKALLNRFESRRRLVHSRHSGSLHYRLQHQQPQQQLGPALLPAPSLPAAAAASAAAARQSSSPPRLFALHSAASAPALSNYRTAGAAAAPALPPAADLPRVGGGAGLVEATLRLPSFLSRGACEHSQSAAAIIE